MGLVLVLLGPLVCLIARSSDLNVDVDVDMNEGWRIGLNLSCLFLGSVLYIYTILVDTLIYMQTELLTVPIPYPISQRKRTPHNAMPCITINSNNKTNTSPFSRHIHILSPILKLRIRQSHKDIIILIITKRNTGPITPQPQRINPSRKRSSNTLCLPQRHLHRLLLRNKLIQCISFVRKHIILPLALKFPIKLQPHNLPISSHTLFPPPPISKTLHAHHLLAPRLETAAVTLIAHAIKEHFARFAAGEGGGVLERICDG